MEARFDYLCFVHEDVLFETSHWGEKIKTIFNSDPKIGVIGVAGNKYKSAFCSGWYAGRKELDCGRINHRYPQGDQLIDLRPENNSPLERVVCVDGVFICCRKECWAQTKFAEERLPGFHFYDIDFSIRAAKSFTVAVTFDILLTHITSGGDFGNNWIKTALDYHKSDKIELPATILEQVPPGIDMHIVKIWLDVLKNYKINWSYKWKWVSSQELLKYPRLYYSVIKFFLYKPLGLRRIHKPGK
jgi:hypothetical protein